MRLFQKKYKIIMEAASEDDIKKMHDIYIKLSDDETKAQQKWKKTLDKKKLCILNTQKKKTVVLKLSKFEANPERYIKYAESFIDKNQDEEADESDIDAKITKVKAQVKAIQKKVEAGEIKPAEAKSELTTIYKDAKKDDPKVAATVKPVIKSSLSDIKTSTDKKEQPTQQSAQKKQQKKQQKESKETSSPSSTEDKGLIFFGKTTIKRSSLDGKFKFKPDSRFEVTDKITTTKSGNNVFKGRNKYENEFYYVFEGIAGTPSNSLQSQSNACQKAKLDAMRGMNKYVQKNKIKISGTESQTQIYKVKIGNKDRFFAVAQLYVPKNKLDKFKDKPQWILSDKEKALKPQKAPKMSKEMEDALL